MKKRDYLEQWLNLSYFEIHHKTTDVEMWITAPTIAKYRNSSQPCCQRSLSLCIWEKKIPHCHTPVLAFSLELQNQPIFPSISGSTALLFSVKCTLGYSIDCFHRNITPKKHFRLKLFPCEHKTTYPRARPHSIERFDDKRVVLATVNVILCI